MLSWTIYVCLIGSVAQRLMPRNDPRPARAAITPIGSRTRPDLSFVLVVAIPRKPAKSNNDWIKQALNLAQQIKHYSIF